MVVVNFHELCNFALVKQSKMKVTFKRIACMVGLLMAVGFRASFRFQDTRRRSSGS